MQTPVLCDNCLAATVNPKRQQLENHETIPNRRRDGAVLFALRPGQSCPLFALGIRLPDQDAFATARGNAFVATADDPSAVYYNPAGITQLDGANLSLGMYGIELASRYTSAAGSSINSQQQWAGPAPGFFHHEFHQLSSRPRLGNLFPLRPAMAWPKNAPWVGSGLPQSGEIDYIRANPVLAYQPFEHLFHRRRCDARLFPG